jgi:ASC-1-like (ASCH) protein
MTSWFDEGAGYKTFSLEHNHFQNVRLGLKTVEGRRGDRVLAKDLRVGDYFIFASPGGHEKIFARCLEMNHYDSIESMLADERNANLLPSHHELASKIEVYTTLYSDANLRIEHGMRTFSFIVLNSWIGVQLFFIFLF